jgi:hypothetical protein
MRHHLTSIAAALSVVVVSSVSAQDYSRPSAATGLTLDEIAATTLNRGTTSDERQAIVSTSGPVEIDAVRHAQLIAASRVTPADAAGTSLNFLAASKHNAESRRSDGQRVAGSDGTRRWTAQLAYSAGLTPAEAETMTLTEIAAVKFDRDTGDAQ